MAGFSLGVGFGEKSIHSGLSVRVSHSFVLFCFDLFHVVAWVFFDESFEFEPPCFLSCCQTFKGFEICMEHTYSRRKELCFFLKLSCGSLIYHCGFGDFGHCRMVDAKGRQEDLRIAVLKQSRKRGNLAEVDQSLKT